MSWAECSPCGLVFTSTSAFDKHRVGKHAYTFREGLEMDPPREDGRRCLGEDELVALDWRQNRYGRWHPPSRGWSDSRLEELRLRG